MRKALCLILAVLPALPLRAQWSGSADLAVGLGGMGGSVASEGRPMWNATTRGTFQLDYKTDKFSWGTTLNVKWESKTTDNTRFSAKKERLALTHKASLNQPLTASLKSVFAWTPDRERNYSASILYQFSHTRGENHSINASGKAEGADDFSYYYEYPGKDEHKLEAGLKTNRSFSSGRSILQSSLTIGAVGSQTLNNWTVVKTDSGDGKGTGVTIEDTQAYVWRYRITPNSLDLNLDGDIHLQRTVRDDDILLRFTPGARISAKQALDRNSGATRIRDDILDDKNTEAWRDSSRLRESFNYLSLWVDPYLTADFKWKKLEVHADYALQVYARRLNDDSHLQRLKVKGVYPVGKANLKWTISPVHSLNLTNQLSVSHPDYLKICWYDRTAGYLDQLYRGNEHLLSPLTQRYGLEYELKLKRFLARTTLSYTRVINEIDQTWTNEEIDGRLYKVFQWLNSSDSRAFGIAQSVGWRGKVITANASVTYNRTRRVSRTSGAVKDNFDWRLNTDITAKLGRGWTLGADARYQSKTATFFTMFKGYCTFNARVQKEFKRFTLYLEGRDLLDQATETTFESEELQEYWIEEVRNNRRIILLGARWKF